MSSVYDRNSVRVDHQGVNITFLLNDNVASVDSLTNPKALLVEKPAALLGLFEVLPHLDAIFEAIAKRAPEGDPLTRHTLVSLVVEMGNLDEDTVDPCTIVLTSTKKRTPVYSIREESITIRCYEFLVQLVAELSKEKKLRLGNDADFQHKFLARWNTSIGFMEELPELACLVFSEELVQT